MTGKWKLRKFEWQKFRRNTEGLAAGCIIGSNSRMSIVPFLDNRVSLPVLSVGIWLRGGKECETRVQRLGFAPPHALPLPRRSQEPVVPLEDQGATWVPAEERSLRVSAQGHIRVRASGNLLGGAGRGGSGVLKLAELSGPSPGGPEVGVQTPLCWAAGYFTCRASEVGAVRAPSSWPCAGRELGVKRPVQGRPAVSPWEAPAAAGGCAVLPQCLCISGLLLPPGGLA